MLATYCPVDLIILAHVNNNQYILALNEIATTIEAILPATINRVVANMPYVSLIFCFERAPFKHCDYLLRKIKKEMNECEFTHLVLDHVSKTMVAFSHADVPRTKEIMSTIAMFNNVII